MKKVIYIIIFALITTGGVGGIYFYKIFYESNTLFNEEYVFVKIPTNSTENQLLDSIGKHVDCLLYTSPSPRDKRQSRMPSSA